MATSLLYVLAPSFTFDAIHIGRTVLLNSIGSLISSKAALDSDIHVRQLRAKYSKSEERFERHEQLWILFY